LGLEPFPFGPEPLAIRTGGLSRHSLLRITYPEALNKYGPLITLGSVQVVTDAVGGAFLRYTVVGREGNKAVRQYGNDRAPGPTDSRMNPVISHDLSITVFDYVHRPTPERRFQTISR
jgi:hypothetical protein